MKLLRFAAWTVWFMLAWISLASAEPVSALIAGIAGLLKAGGIGAMLIKAAFGIALQVGASLLQKAMTKNRTQAQPGISGQLQVGGNNSLSFVVGDYATAGSLEYTGEWGAVGGTPNAYHVQVITLSDLPQGGVGRRVWINGQRCEIDFDASPAEMGYPVVEFRQGGQDHFWIKVLDGAQVASDAYLLDRFGAHAERPWQSDMIGRGCTVVVMTALVNRQLLTQLPSGRFEPLALALYDPRKDSTVGGSGAHRWGVPSTYEATRNNAVVIYNILRGIWYEGELLYGPAIPATRLPLANWFAAMNECDLPVDGAAQFRCGYEIKIAEHQPIDVIQELLKGCNGKIAEVGGIYKIHVGAPALPAAFITDDDFVVTEEQEFDPFPGLEATFNGATASYPAPEAGWEMKDAPQRLFPALEVEDDGRRLLADFQFGSVPHPLQVQRLMKSMVEDGRRFRKHRGTLGPWAFVLEPLDTIGWTSPREGYVSKLFQVDSIDDEVNANQAVAIREADPADFDWNFATDGLPWFVGPLVPQWPVAQTIVGWQVFPATIGTGGKKLPSVEVRYPGNLDDVRAVRVQVRTDADQAVIFDGEVPYGSPLTNPNPSSVVLSGTFPPDTDLEVRGILVPYSARATDWTSWLDVRTPDVWINDIYPIDIDRLSGDIEGYLEWVGGGIREIERRFEEIELWIGDQDFGNEHDRQEVRKQVTATYEYSKAEWTYEVTVLASANAALSARIETLSSTVVAQSGQILGNSTAISGLQTSVTTINGVTQAQADAITALSASSVSGDIAQANMRMGVASGPTGYSRIVYETRYGGTGAWRGAAIGLDTPADAGQKTRFWVRADQTLVLDSSNNLSAMFEGDTAYFNNARIHNLDANNINVAALTAASGFFDNVYIDSSLQLGPNVVTSGAISPGTIFNSANNYISRTAHPDYLPGNGLDFANWLSITIDSPALLPIMIFCGFNIFQTSQPSTGGGVPGLYLEIRILLNGNVIPGLYYSGSVTGYSQYLELVNSFMAMPSISQVTNTITVQGRARINYPAWNVQYLAFGTITLTAQCGKVS